LLKAEQTACAQIKRGSDPRGIFRKKEVPVSGAGQAKLDLELVEFGDSLLL